MLSALMPVVVTPSNTKNLSSSFAESIFVICVGSTKLATTRGEQKISTIVDLQPKPFEGLFYSFGVLAHKGKSLCNHPRDYEAMI